MNAEELKLIVDTITALGVQGKEAFIWWLVAKYLVNAVFGMGMFLIGGITVWKVVKLLIGANHEQQMLREIRSIVSAGAYGAYDLHDHGVVIQRIRELKK